MKLILSTLVVMTAITLAGYAEDKPREPGKRPGGNGWSKGREGGMKYVDTLLEKIKEKNPERYEELIKLRETDRRKFMQELRSEKTQNGDRPDRDGEKPGGPRRGPAHGKRFGERFLDHLKAQDPERFERIQKLRKENPEEYRKEMGQIFSSFRKKHFKKDERIESLVSAHKKAATEEEKAKIKEQLREAISEGFEKRMKMKEEELENLKKRIEEIEKAHNSHRESKEAICNKRLEELLERGNDGNNGNRKQRPPQP